MKRAAATVLTVAGLTLVLIAVMGAVLVGVDGEWSAEGEVPAGRSAVLVEPALASVLGPHVSLRVAVAEPALRMPSGKPAGATELFVGRTRPDDARALVDGVDHVVVAALDGSRRLDVQRLSGPYPLPSPSGVDLWHQSAKGVGSAELGWRPTRGAESFVVSQSNGGPMPALRLEMAWRDGSWRLLPLAIAVVGLVLLGAAAAVRRGLPGVRTGLTAAAADPTPVEVPETAPSGPAEKITTVTAGADAEPSTEPATEALPTRRSRRLESGR